VVRLSMRCARLSRRICKQRVSMHDEGKPSGKKKRVSVARVKLRALWRPAPAPPAPKASKMLPQEKGVSSPPEAAAAPAAPAASSKKPFKSFWVSPPPEALPATAEPAAPATPAKKATPANDRPSRPECRPLCAFFSKTAPRRHDISNGRILSPVATRTHAKTPTFLNSKYNILLFYF